MAAASLVRGAAVAYSGGRETMALAPTFPRAALSAALGLGLLASCGSDPVPAATPSPIPPPDPLFVGAGDIATCGSDGQEATARLLDVLFPPGTPLSAGFVFVLGDNAYERGTIGEYAGCYDPSWGRHRDRTRPAPGNHDYLTPGAQGYYAYFGAAAGDPAGGYYSFDLGAWHGVVLNSNYEAIGGCGAGSPQETWLRTDLAAHPSACAIAYWHHPRFSSGTVHGDHAFMRDLWRTLRQFGVDVVLSGHEHNYERFAPRDADGGPDPARGIREFVVGTGGRDLYPLGPAQPTSEARSDTTHGVLKLTLHPGSYDWEFRPVAGAAFADSGRATCH